MQPYPRVVGRGPPIVGNHASLIVEYGELEGRLLQGDVLEPESTAVGDGNHASLTVEYGELEGRLLRGDGLEPESTGSSAVIEYSRAPGDTLNA